MLLNVIMVIAVIWLTLSKLINFPKTIRHYYNQEYNKSVNVIICSM
jgi:hypothetical protein